MANYQKMYAIVCGAASDALDALQAGDTAIAGKLLAAALTKAEELYLDDETA